MVILEVPAIVVGICLAKGGLKSMDTRKELVRDILFGKSLFLLGGGLLIGYVSTETSMKQLDPLFVDLFKG